MTAMKQFLSLLFIPLALAQSSSSTVNLGYATYEGFFDATTNTTEFIGVRYAAPPTGDLRWQPPQPPANSTEVLQANTEAPQCMQASTGAALTTPFRTTPAKRAVTASEDCLFLNVYVSGNITPDANLPVLVWIHGGGYVAGDTSTFNGNDLIQDGDGGIIVVEIQYRLGLFGFLAGSTVKENGTLNVGLLDQNFALQWVQDHICDFGGDPNHVTIWGESAGAGSVLQHIVAHGGKTNPPLFKIAMTSSTFLPSQYAYNDSIPETEFSEVLAQTNCSSAADAMSCLRAVDVSVLEAANNNISLSGFAGTFVWVPVIDGDFIVERPTVTIAKGHLNGESLLAMTNAFEGTVFVNPSTTSTLQSYIANLFPKFGDDQVNAAVAQYTDIGFNDPLDEAIGVEGESIFICPTYYLLNAFSGRAYKGLFAVPPGTHGEDVSVYFFSMGPSFNNATFVKSFAGAFLDMAKSGNPNIKSDPTNITPRWPLWSKHNQQEMLFNRTDAGLVDIRTFPTNESLVERCNFWQSVGNSTAQ